MLESAEPRVEPRVGAEPSEVHRPGQRRGARRDQLAWFGRRRTRRRRARGNKAARNRCAALGTSKYAGFSDWRMPTRMEMASIIDPTRGSKGFAEISITSGYYDTGSWWYETITGQNTSGFHWAYGANGFTSNAVVMTASN
ncbi:MAG: DUF1566 domain-containing protein, partial [Polyangiaceae bacterium]